MASELAIAAVCEAICRILDTAAQEDAAALGLDELDIKCQVYAAKDFETMPISIGISVFLYRVLPSLSFRTPPGRVRTDGKRQRTRLPVDLHLLITAWGDNAGTQHKLVGWLMRTLEDYPTIPANLLNQGFSSTFQPDEAVELVVGEMPNDELLQFWDLVKKDKPTYHVTIPYVARAVMIESRRVMPDAEAVQVRGFEMDTLEDGE